MSLVGDVGRSGEVLVDGEGGVFEGGVAEAEAEFVDGGDVAVVEGAVVDEDAFLEIVLRDGLVRGVEDVCAVVGAVFADCEREFCAGVDAAVEDVCDGVA